MTMVGRTSMNDHRNFFWSEDIEEQIADLIQEGMWHEDGPFTIAHEVLSALLPIVRQALNDSAMRQDSERPGVDADPRP